MRLTIGALIVTVGMLMAGAMGATLALQPTDRRLTLGQWALATIGAGIALEMMALGTLLASMRG